MIKSGTVVLLLALCSWGIVEGFNFERDVLSHFRPKRQLKKICANELYSAPLNSICKTPPSMAQTAAVTKCLGSLKMKSLADGEPMCIFDCVYQANKWVSAAGAVDAKKTEADNVKGLDKTWGPVVSAAAKKCGGIAGQFAGKPLASGYASKCKPGGYVMQTCMMTELYGNCPAAARSPMYAAGKAALAACDATAPFKTTAELAKSAMAGASKIDPAMLAAAQKDPKAMLAKLGGKLPPLPAGMDVKALMASGKVPNNLAALMGR